jgi:hypothetical protein
MEARRIIVCLIVFSFLFPEAGMAISKIKTARSRVLVTEKKMAEIVVSPGEEAVGFTMVTFDYNIKDKISEWKIVDKSGKVYFSCEVVDRNTGSLKNSGDLPKLKLGPGKYTLELLTQNGVVELKYSLEKSKEQTAR